MLALAAAFSALALLVGDLPTAQQLRAESHRALAGTGADCYGFSLDYLQRLRAAGIPARMVIVQSTMTNLYDSHTFVEVEVGGRWVIQDATFDGAWRVDGRLVGTAELQRALARGTWRRARWTGPAKPMRDYYVDPRLLFRNARYRGFDANGDLVRMRAATRVHTLPALYYTQTRRPSSNAAGMLVMKGGSGWRYRGYAFAKLPDGRWISPIIFLPANTRAIRPTGTGRGRLEVRWVSRYR